MVDEYDGSAVELEEDVYNGEAGHALKHNAVNKQANWLTEQWNARAGDPLLAAASDRSIAVKKIGGPRRVAAIGDSTVANFQGPDFPGQIGDTATGWLMIGCLSSGGRLEYGYNFGVPGETSAQVMARIGDVLAFPPDACVILCGRNDGGLAPSVTLGHIDTMVTALRGAGITPVLATLCPFNSSGSGGDEAELARIRALNGAVREYARNNDYAVCEFYAALVDPVTGLYRAGMSLDVNHPNVAGCSLMASAFLAAVAPHEGGRVYRRVDNTLSAEEVISNGLMLGGSGGVPDGWVFDRGTGADTHAQVDNSEFVGKAFEVVTPASSTPTIYFGRAASTPVTIGKTYEVSFRTQVIGATPTNAGQLSLEVSQAGTGILYRRFRFYANAVGTQTYRFVAAVDHFNLTFQVQNGLVENQLTTRVGEVSVRQID